MFERIRESKRNAGEGGFTLIELLVVIIILGILAAVVVFAVGGVGDRGQSASCKIDARTIRTAQEAFYANDKEGLPNYGSEQQLVDGGFLSELSAYHDVTPVAPVDAAPTGNFPGTEDTEASFTLTPIAPCT